MTTGDVAPARPTSKKISVLIPAFNEAENMPDLFAELASACRAHDLDAEIVLVDDGSTDGTLEGARRAADELRRRAKRFSQELPQAINPTASGAQFLDVDPLEIAAALMEIAATSDDQ